MREASEEAFELDVPGKLCSVSRVVPWATQALCCVSAVGAERYSTLLVSVFCVLTIEDALRRLCWKTSWWSLANVGVYASYVGSSVLVLARILIAVSLTLLMVCFWTTIQTSRMSCYCFQLKLHYQMRLLGL